MAHLEIYESVLYQTFLYERDSDLALSCDISCLEANEGDEDFLHSGEERDSNFIDLSQCHFMTPVDKFNTMFEKTFTCRCELIIQMEKEEKHFQKMY